MFITFEGIEGSGKTTAIGRAAEMLNKSGLEVLLTREPGASSIGAAVRSILLDPASKQMTPAAELYLYLADRAQHVAKIIAPALTQGKIVLCDRYIDSTIAYQGYARGLDIAQLQSLNKLATGNLLPDITMLLDLPVKVGLERARRRNSLTGSCAKEGRFEEETMEFHQRVREGFLALAAENPQRFVIVNAAPPADMVSAAVCSELGKKFKISCPKS